MEILWRAFFAVLLLTGCNSMTSYNLQLKPGGIIPPDLNLGVQMSRVTPVVAPVVATPTECPPLVTPRLPAGADNFADAAEISLDFFSPGISDGISEYTYSQGLTAEANEPNPPADGDVSGTTPVHRSAWWKLFVPVGNTLQIAPDMSLSFLLDPVGNYAGAALVFYMLSETPAFANLTALDSIICGLAPIAPCNLFWRQISGTDSGNPDGTWFYFQIFDENTSSPDGLGIGYVLRLTVSDSAQTCGVPSDGHDPSL